MQLSGIHHLTAVTAQAARNYAFYTGTLGLRLVKKTVNQDDVSAYHLFYADGRATPGSDITFFDWPAAHETRGTRSVVRTAFRLRDEASLNWWQERLAAQGGEAVSRHDRDGRASLDFEDFEGQRLSFVCDANPGQAHPWEKSSVPVEHQILGLGPITMSVGRLAPTDRVLREVLNMRQVREYKSSGGSPVNVYEMGSGGAAAELHVQLDADLSPARQGAGAVHHVAFRTPDSKEYQAWNARLEEMGIPCSGPVDRFYFQSLYFREPGGILFEIATDGPGFATDESWESLGEGLALPPFLEPRRQAIEAQLKPLIVK